MRQSPKKRETAPNDRAQDPVGVEQVLLANDLIETARADLVS
ncbi:hypothetical protein [Actinomyces faecalis]|nr:hypothetical protein [Actinomyces faecalis]